MSNAPVFIGGGSAFSGATISGFTFTSSVNAAIGDALFVRGGAFISGTVSTIVDSVSNTYTVLQSASSGGYFSFLGYCLSATHAIVSASTTFTVNFSGSTAATLWGAAAEKVVAGLAALDKNTSGTQSATTSLSCGATGATTSAVELVIASFAERDATVTAPTFTAGGSYTALTPEVANDGASAIAGFGEYLITAATGAQTATGTIGNGGDGFRSAGVIATFTYPTVDPFPAGYGVPFGHSGQSQMQQLLARARRRVYRRPSGIWAPQY